MIYIMQPSFTTNEKLKILAIQGRPNSNHPTEFSNMPILEKFMGKIDKVYEKIFMFLYMSSHHLQNLNKMSTRKSAGLQLTDL